MPLTTRLEVQTYIMLHEAVALTGESANWIINRLTQERLADWPPWLKALVRTPEELEGRFIPESRYAADGNGNDTTH